MEGHKDTFEFEWTQQKCVCIYICKHTFAVGTLMANTNRICGPASESLM